MQYFLCIPLFLLIAFPAWADEPAKTDTLTPKEVEDGWLLLFDGKTTFGWKIDGEAKVVDGTLILGGAKATIASPTTRFGNVELHLESHGVAQLVVANGKGSSGLGLTQQKSVLNLKTDNNAGQELGIHSQFRVDQDGTRVDDATFTADGSSSLALRFEVPAGAKLSLKSVKLKPSGLKPIFNGKDLSGWKEIKTNRTKSQFTVTPEGWINIKNGPGDLQTESQWGNFVLQIDCFSNGRNLNSGVFFRCQPDKYQQGYEAQIHNGFTAEPAKTYTLKEYDPKTHKQTGEKKVKYAAIDYGTGAIYNRQPARFQVAKDHEWFTMTIVAEGNHFAVWVNGIEVTDWTDNRPPSDNARNGFRQEKGPISLQGHDPTTNLNFRNIRIAELPPPAGDSGVPNEKK